MIIAIDGPAAAGKGTLARALAAHYGLAVLDTGLIYRAVAAKLLRQGGDPNDGAAATDAARGLTPADLAAPGLREERVSEAASVVAAKPSVRAVLLQFQRDFARHPPGNVNGAVLDGRDIGTVICPEPDVHKLFVRASLETRARRRAVELRARGEPGDEAQVLADMRQRDERDSTRGVAALVKAPDALDLDTSTLDPAAVLARAIAFIEGRRRASR